MPNDRNGRAELSRRRAGFEIYAEGEPHRAPGHQLTYSYGAIAACTACDRGQVERGEHDCFQFDEAWDWYAWYLLDPDDYRALRGAIRRCPMPTWPRCDCPVHRALAQGVRALPIEPRWEAVLPEWAPREELAPHVFRVHLSWGSEGEPILGFQPLPPSAPATVRAMLGARFREALAYAAEAHEEELRKGTKIPYVSHLLGVAALVLEDGGDEDQAIAALLHDVCENHGGRARLEDVRTRFGERVANIVDACTDSYESSKPPWKERKDLYLVHVRATHDADALRVSLADKMHNARAILRDLNAAEDPAVVWDRFNAGRDCVLWYYRALVDAFRMRTRSPMVEELDAVVTEMEIVAGGPSKGCREGAWPRR